METKTIVVAEIGSPFTLEEHRRLVKLFVAYFHLIQELSTNKAVLLTQKLTFLNLQATLHQLIDVAPDIVRLEMEHLDSIIEQGETYNIQQRLDNLNKQ